MLKANCFDLVLTDTITTRVVLSGLLSGTRQRTKGFTYPSQTANTILPYIDNQGQSVSTEACTIMQSHSYIFIFTDQELLCMRTPSDSVLATISA